MMRRVGIHGAGFVPISSMGACPSGGAVACVVQPFLLDFVGSYAGAEGPYNDTLGREFQVTANATCLGSRFKSPVIQTVKIKLYRVSDLALLASETLGAVIGVNLLYFSVPAAVVPVESYRICHYSATVNDYFAIGADHPDGPITILTDACFEYAVGDVYPGVHAGGVSNGCEPIICV